MRICGSRLKTKKNSAYPLGIIPHSFKIIHVIRFIQSNKISDLQLEWIKRPPSPGRC